MFKHRLQYQQKEKSRNAILQLVCFYPKSIQPAISPSDRSTLPIEKWQTDF